MRELTRIATAETEAAWLAWAATRRVHEIEKAVATRKPGQRPHDRGDTSLVTHRLVFEVRPETMAMFRDLEAAVRSDLGAVTDHDTLLYEIARRALGGPTDDARASYQIAVTRCDACGRTGIEAAGHTHDVDELVSEMAGCDAQTLGRVDALPDRSPHVGAAKPASQAVPPATRRAVMRRDRKRCVVPGCKNHRFLDVHHLDPRSEGGGHDPDRLAVLCGAHHRAVHAGVLRIDGSGSAGFEVRHADGAAYGARADLSAINVVAQVLGALGQMGFKPTRARALVDEALRRVSPNDATVVLEAALRAT